MGRKQSHLQQQMHQEAQEESQEHGRVNTQLLASTGNNVVVFYVVNDVEQAQHTCQEEHSDTQNYIPNIEQRVKSMTSVWPNG